jgi:phosphate transport system substrate-binding protein
MKSRYVILLFCVILNSCGKDEVDKDEIDKEEIEQIEEEEKDDPPSTDPDPVREIDIAEFDVESIEGLTVENYPRVDGSTSTYSLNRLIACKLMGYPAQWRFESSTELWTINPKWYEIPNSYSNPIFRDKIKLSQTHNSFINLIDDEADIILSARKMSADEEAYATEANVTLIETPVALDAFIMLLNSGNPVESLTPQQILDIYTGKVTNWRETGGEDSKIHPYIRNANSGSQELMELFVMKGLPMLEWDEESGIEWYLPNMGAVYTRLQDDPDGICYTVYYYHDQLINETYKNKVKSIAVNGIFPDRNTIEDRSYPYAAEVYAIIRSDLDKNSMAYKLYEWLLSASGQEVIARSGYVKIK